MFSNSLFWMMINIIVSVSFIYGANCLWIYLKENYSTRRTKDLVNTQIQKYKDIVSEMCENEKNSVKSGSPSFLSSEEKENMSKELESFLIENIR